MAITKEVLGNSKGESEQVYWIVLGLKQHEVRKEYFDSDSVELTINALEVL